MKSDKPWHLAWPILALNLLLIGLYFSGSALLQSLITPQIEGMEPRQQREFGLLEMIQNLFIIATFAVYISLLLKPRTPVSITECTSGIS